MLNHVTLAETSAMLFEGTTPGFVSVPPVFSKYLMIFSLDGTLQKLNLIVQVLIFGAEFQVLHS
jgi:hypothetical protein